MIRSANEWCSTHSWFLRELWSAENHAWHVLPTKKKQKTSVEWGSSELPSIPVLVNKKAISKHTKLAVFLKEPAKKKDGA